MLHDYISFVKKRLKQMDSVSVVTSYNCNFQDRAWQSSSSYGLKPHTPTPAIRRSNLFTISLKGKIWKSELFKLEFNLDS